MENTEIERVKELARKQERGESTASAPLEDVLNAYRFIHQDCLGGKSPDELGLRMRK